MIKKVNYLGFTLLNEKYVKARKNFHEGSVLTMSPNSYGLSTRVHSLEKSLKRDGLLVLDGVYFSLGFFCRTGQWIVKNQGPEIFYEELEIQRAKSGRVFFLGSSNQTLERISKRMRTDYPQISFKTLSPPFKPTLSKEDNHAIESSIKEFNPDVVFVGMTCPRQEVWIDENSKKYHGIIFMGIGGVFDWFAGNYKELHPLWWRLRMGWLGRILQRPEILRRNLPFILIYLRDMLKDVILKKNAAKNLS